MEIRQVALILTIGISIFFLIKAGSLAGKLFYDKVFQLKQENKNTKTINFLYNFIVPFFAGNMLILFLNFNTVELKDFLLISSMLICLIPINFTKISGDKAESSTPQPDIITALILMTIASTGLFITWFLLKDGLVLG